MYKLLFCFQFLIGTLANVSSPNLFTNALNLLVGKTIAKLYQNGQQLIRLTFLSVICMVKYIVAFM